MLGLLQNVLPYTPAVLGVINASGAWKSGAPCKADRMQMPHRIVSSLCDFVAIMVIAWAAVDISSQRGHKAAIAVAFAFVSLAIILPRIAIEPLVIQLCNGCSVFGKISVGIVSLIAIGIVNYLLCSAVLW